MQMEDKRQTGMKTIKLLTFNESRLSFFNVPIGELDRACEIAKQSNGKRFKVRIDGMGSVEIDYEQLTSFTIGIYNQSRWVTTLHITPDSMHVGNVFKVLPKSIETLMATGNEPRVIYTTFKITNLSIEQLRRVDFKGNGTVWFSVFSHDGNALFVRPNGDWTSEKMLYMHDQLSTQAVNNYRRNNGWPVLESNDTLVMHRRRSTLTSQEDDVIQDNTEIERKTNQMEAKKREIDRKEKELVKKSTDLDRQMARLVAKLDETHQKEEKLMQDWETVERNVVELERKQREINDKEDALKGKTASVNRWEKELDHKIAALAKQNGEYNNRKAEFDLDWSKLTKQEDYLHTRFDLATRFEQEIKEKLANNAEKAAKLEVQLVAQQPVEVIQRQVDETGKQKIHPNEPTTMRIGNIFKRTMINGRAVLMLA